MQTHAGGPAFPMNFPASKPENARRILCVDDEPTLRELLQMYLQQHGFTVETASDGQAAWEMIAENPTRFAAVVTDNQMPRMTGLQLIEKLGEHQFAGRIFLFSSTAAQNAGPLARLGIDAVIEKGRPISELLNALQRAL